MAATESDEQPEPARRTGMTRSEWGLILVLAAVQFTHIVDFVILMPLGGRLMTELGITPDRFGHVVAAYGLAAFVSSVLAAGVMDRFGRKAVLLTMYAGFGVSTLFCGLAGSYEVLLLSRTLAGAFGGLAAAAIFAVIGDVFPDARRGTATGAVMSAFAVASILGLPAGLYLAAWLGRGAPFVAVAGLSVAVWALAFRLLPPLRGHIRAGAQRHPMAELAAVAREPAHLRAFAFTFCLVIGTFTVASFIGAYMTLNGGLTEADLATMYMAAGAMTLVGMNVTGRVADRVSRVWLFRLLALATIGMAVAITTLPPPGLVGACLLCGGFMVFASARMVPAQAMLVGVPRPEVRGGFLSLNTAVQHLATGCAPIIAGAVVSKGADGKLIGYPLVGLIAATAAAVALVLAGRLRPAAAAAAADVSEPEPAAAAAEPVAV